MNKQITEWIESDSITQQIEKFAESYDLEVVQYDYGFGQGALRVGVLLEGAWYEGDLEKLAGKLESFFENNFPYDYEMIYFDTIEYWTDEYNAEIERPELHFEFVY